MNLSYTIDRWQRLYLWLLRKGPRIVAQWLARKALDVHHDECTAWCWPCEAKARYKYDRHTRTIGPAAIEYCTKCGLDYYTWPTWCSNRVEKVNNKPEAKPRHVSVGWDE